jgi:putative mRNA 3-end processing factor
LSDHADWEGLIGAIKATECETVYLTHGYTASFSRYLTEIGYDAHEAHTIYGGDEVNEADEDPVKLVNDDGEVFSEAGAAADGGSDSEDLEVKEINGGKEKLGALKPSLTDAEKSIALKKAKRLGGAL